MSDFDQGRVETLWGGHVVPPVPYALLVRLLLSRFTVRRDGDALLVEEPKRAAGQPPVRLTEQDSDEIRRWKHHLLVMLDHCTRPNHNAHLFTDAATAATEHPSVADHDQAF